MTNEELPFELEKALKPAEKIINLLKEALTGHSSRSKNSLIKEVMQIVKKELLDS